MSKFSERKTPPDTEDEHRYIWTAADRAHQLWQVFGPLAQVVQSWRWWVTAAVVVLWLYRTDIRAALSILMGGQP